MRHLRQAEPEPQTKIPGPLQKLHPLNKNRISKNNHGYINIYAPLAKEANIFLENHKPHENMMMSCDFNCNHNLCYAEVAVAPRIYENIRNDKWNADPWVEYSQLHVVTLQNIQEPSHTSRTTDTNQQPPTSHVPAATAQQCPRTGHAMKDQEASRIKQQPTQH